MDLGAERTRTDEAQPAALEAAAEAAAASPEAAAAAAADAYTLCSQAS